jgi:hypothetical protein
MVRRNFENLNKKEIIEEIMKKKEFSELPVEDVYLAYSQFEKREDLIEDKIKLTRDLLRRMYTAFVGDKLLNVKDKDAEWFLKKHISTKERLSYFEELYRRILSGMEKCLTVIDFGSGINGFSFEYFKKVGFDVGYLGIEPVGQLVDLQNNYFKINRIYGAKCVKASLFDLEDVERLVSETKNYRVGFFFKVLDSLEMLTRDYSKEVLIKLSPFFDRFVVSWATKSLVSRKKFYADRKWLRDFVEKEFFIVDEFDLGGEHYLIFEKVV